ncbi:WW domain-binding protein 2 isoform X2 [Aethina tumida]|uniref:WW domain-binding protein 2 isoform X2 n=1 Tax=Aethina tumida TaxID=116153 RepID=UPI00096AEA10|nr:WW domain-binding protein 2 isoform X2 [Aethina tumida]
MSLNTAHLNGGVLIHSGEQIMLFSEHVQMEWSGQNQSAFRGTKSGRIYLTTHRLIFNNKSPQDELQSFSFPFITLSEVEVEQPIFGANYIKGKVRAQPNGNWTGEARFKLTFKHGGAIEFGQAMLRVAQMASQGGFRQPPPPYVPPQTQYYAAPPPAYAPPPQGYYGWMPPTNVFPQQPPQNGVFMTDAPPPYPGIGPGGFPPQQGGYPQSQGPYPPTPQGYQGYPPQQGGYQGYPPPQGGFPPQGAAGFQNPADAKAAEAAQSAYYDPNRPQMAYVPPPAYYENPPSYNQATNKKDQ